HAYGGAAGCLLFRADHRCSASPEGIRLAIPAPVAPARSVRHWAEERDQAARLAVHCRSCGRGPGLCQRPLALRRLQVAPCSRSHPRRGRYQDRILSKFPRQSAQRYDRRRAWLGARWAWIVLLRQADEPGCFVIPPLSRPSTVSSASWAECTSWTRLHASFSEFPSLT